MAYLLPDLRTGWEVDQAILGEDKKLVVSLIKSDYKVWDP
jgi:hypothetical protein